MAGGKSADPLVKESWQDTDLESTGTDIMRECFSLSFATNPRKIFNAYYSA